MDLQILSRRPFPGVQRGAASVAIAMLIMFILAAAVAASMFMSGSSVRDAATNEEQIAALYLAESGLERAMGILSSAGSSDTMNGSVCLGINDGVTYPLPRGNFKYGGATPSPNASCTGAECTGCSVQVTGNVITGNVVTASRTLNLKINLGVDNGVSGFGNQVTMNLKNFYNVPATVVFNLAWRRKGCESHDLSDCTDPDSQTNASTVPGQNACVGCRWYVESSNGNPSVGSMGVTTYVGANLVVSLPVTQYIVTDQPTSRSYAEVAGLFPSVSDDPNTPTVIGSFGFWHDKETTTTSASGTATGHTNNGVANSTDVCENPFDLNGNYVQSQPCKSWCYGADTLALGISGRVFTPASGQSFGPVSFNGTPMKSIAHFERTDMLTDLFSEIWYANNPNYPNSPSSLSPPAYSGGVVTGAIGVTTFSGDTTNNLTTLTVSAPSDNLLKIGDIISCASNPCPIPNNTTITAFVSGGGGAGTYTLSNQATSSTTGKSMQAARSSNVLSVTGFTSGYLSVGDTITGAGISNGTTIEAVGTGLGGTGVTGTGNATLGTYILNNNLQTVSPTSITAAGSTINVPGGTIAPTAGTILAVYSGTGTFAPNTTVSAILTSNPTSFKVSATPTTMLSGATICGGICALFNAPNLSNSTTPFTVTSTSSTTQWAAGFTCLSGVDKSKIKAVTTSKTIASAWTEVVR